MPELALTPEVRFHNRAGFRTELYHAPFNEELKRQLNVIFTRVLDERVDSLKGLRGSGISLKDFEHLHGRSVNSLQKYLRKRYGFELPGSPDQ